MRYINLRLATILAITEIVSQLFASLLRQIENVFEEYA